MLPRKAGVGLQMAGLNKIVELQVPNSLELFRFAWRNGNCQRDIAGCILAKVGTSSDFAPGEVETFFDYFDRADKEEDTTHVADFLLAQLIELPEWRLPYLPKVIAKLALLPGVTSNAIKALLTTTTNPTEVLGALTQIFQAARLAQRTEPRVNRAAKAALLTDLKSAISLSSIRSTLASINQKTTADTADPQVLVTFLEEVLQIWEASVRANADEHKRNYGMSEETMLESALALWVKLLRPGEVRQWLRVIEDLSRRLHAMPCYLKSSVMLGKLLVSRLDTLEDAHAERDQALAVLREFFQRHVEELGAETEATLDAKTLSDAQFQKSIKVRAETQRELLGVWADLLSRGCVAAETAALFARVPCGYEMDLAKIVVDKAVAHAKTALAKKSQHEARWRSARPQVGWAHAGGVPVESLQVGAEVSGAVTNSSSEHGVFVNFGCVRDGKLSVPKADWAKYRIGDRVERMVVNKVVRGKSSGQDMIELLLVSHQPGGTGGQSDAQGPLDIALRAVQWLASPVVLRRARWATLAKLWASAVAVESSGAGFEESLGVLGDLTSKEGSVPPCDMVYLVEKLLAQSPNRDLLRAALSWLAGACPADAVRLWPALLAPSQDEPPEVRDLVKVLALCEANGFKFPTLSGAVARGLPEAALDTLAGCGLPEARLLAVQSLQEKQFNMGSPSELLKTLCSDDSSVVRVAAQLLWSALGGKDLDKTSVQEGEAEEDEESDA
uniref:S1 motif domain-containing protein n=1 Tax=Zooxanthella nutricula TaxID=1333877 RepID=A0A7S2JGX6_9DINO